MVNTTCVGCIILFRKSQNFGHGFHSIKLYFCWLEAIKCTIDVYILEFALEQVKLTEQL